jgi:hypothetical protein
MLQYATVMGAERIIISVCRSKVTWKVMRGFADGDPQYTIVLTRVFSMAG